MHIVRKCKYIADEGREFITRLAVARPQFLNRQPHSGCVRKRLPVPDRSLQQPELRELRDGCRSVPIVSRDPGVGPVQHRERISPSRIERASSTNCPNSASGQTSMERGGNGTSSTSVTNCAARSAAVSF